VSPHPNDGYRRNARGDREHPHGDNKLQLQRGAEVFHACGNRRVLRNIVLSYAIFGQLLIRNFRRSPGSLSSFAYGEAQRSFVDRAPVQLAPHEPAIGSPGTTMKVTHSHDLEHFVLKIDRNALLSKWTA
jgi:hypothetical protein